MALYFLETSALVKLYVREAGTERLLELAAHAKGNQLAILSLAKVELHSAIRRRERSGELASTAADQLLALFHLHLEARFLLQQVSEHLLDTASVMIDRHGLRAYDAVQLAGYLVLRNSAGENVPVFVCADQSLLVAAQREGAPVIDPCSGA